MAYLRSVKGWSHDSEEVGRQGTYSRDPGFEAEILIIGQKRHCVVLIHNVLELRAREFESQGEKKSMGNWLFLFALPLWQVRKF